MQDRDATQANVVDAQSQGLIPPHLADAIVST
jgi:hypothetical protein